MLSKKIYECSNCYDEFSEQLYPVNISDVKWINFICDKYPNGCIQITCHDAQKKCLLCNKTFKMLCKQERQICNLG